MTVLVFKFQAGGYHLEMFFQILFYCVTERDGVVPWVSPVIAK